MARERSFFRCMEDLKNAIFQQRDKEAGKAFAKVLKFVEEGDYSSYKKTQKLARYSLAGDTDFQIAAKLGISEATLRVTRAKVSASLYDIFGKDFFLLMEDYKANKSEIDKRIYMATTERNNTLDYFSADILALIERRAENKEIKQNLKLSDCSREMSFLVEHSFPNILSELEKLDISKVAYLLDLVNGSKGTTKDRYDFMCVMDKQDS